MKNLFLSFLLIASALMSKAQPIPEVVGGCSDLFFSELTFGKNPNGNIWDLNYAVEIFNPTQSTISLSNYTLELTNSIGGTVNLTLTGSIPAGEVHVVANSSADPNLQSMADQLTAGLDFETTVILELKHNGTTIDQIGQNGAPTAGSIDIVQLVQDPYAYLATFHLDLNDYENIDIRRSMFVTQGNPTFNSATDIIGKWGYFLNVDRTNIGTYVGMCNKPTAVDIIGYWDPLPKNLLAANGNIDPLDLNINGTKNGILWNQLPSINEDKLSGTANICNTGAIPFPELGWLGLINGCNFNTFNLNPGNQPRAETSLFAINTAPTQIVLELSSNHPDVWVDFGVGIENHTINITKWALSTNDIAKDAEIKIYPNYTYDDLTIRTTNVIKYSVSNLQGQQIVYGNINSETTIIPTSNLPIGMYLILLTSENGKTYTQKFSKL